MLLKLREMAKKRVIAEEKNVITTHVLHVMVHHRVFVRYYLYRISIIFTLPTIELESFQFTSMYHHNFNNKPDILLTKMYYYIVIFCCLGDDLGKTSGNVLPLIL